MFKVKVALFNAQKSITKGIDKCSQTIVGIEFNQGDVQNTYQKNETVRVFSTEGKQKISWRNESWDALSEEYIVIASEKPFVVLVEKSSLKVIDGKKTEETNKFVQIESRKLEGDDHKWSILSKEDRKYAIVDESEIQKPIFQVIKGAKKR